MTLRMKPLACIALLCVLGMPLAAGAQERILILDGGGGRSEGPAVVAVAAAGGAVLARAELAGWPDQIVRSPDGTRLLVHEVSGPSPAQSMLARDLAGSPPARGDHSLAVLEATTLKAITHLWLGPGSRLALGEAVFSPDGRRVSMVVDSFKAPKKIVVVHRAIVTVDLQSGEIAGWVAVPKEVQNGTMRLIGVAGGERAVAVRTVERSNPCECWDGVRSSEIKLAFIDLAGPSVTGLLPIDGDLAWAGMAPDNASLVLVQRSAPPPKNTLEAPSKVLFIDVATGQVAATVPLSGVVALKYHVTLSPGGKYLYLLDATNGRLDIVSLERRAHAGAFQVGRAPRFVNDISRDRVLVLSAGPAAAPGASAPPGELRLLRDAEIASTVAVVARPFGAGVSESGDRLTVFGEGGITQLSWPALERNGETATSLSPQVLDVRVSSDGRRAFALDAQARVAVLDLASGRLVASVPTSAEQSSAKKWALFALGASVNTLVVVQGGQGLPLPLRAPWERDPREPPATLALRPDGEAAYVFNPNTGTLTTIAAADGRVTGTLAITGRSATTLPGGRMLAIDDAKVLRLFDMTTNKTGGEVPLGSRSTSSDAITLTPLPGGNVVLATRGPSACFLDGATGAVLSQISGLGRVADVVLER